MRIRPAIAALLLGLAAAPALAQPAPPIGVGAIATTPAGPDGTYRVVGTVGPGPFEPHRCCVFSFTLTDGAAAFTVEAPLTLDVRPEEGDRVVVEGRLGLDGILQADAILTRPTEWIAVPPLPGVDRPGITPETFAGRLTLVSVWASWSAPTRYDFPYLATLAADPRVQVVGISVDNDPADALRFLGRYGNPFIALGYQPEPGATLDLGVFGAPETLLIAADGTVLLHLPGRLSDRRMAEIEAAIAAASGG